MDREKKLVTLSMVILFFSLIVVYSLFYQVKGDEIITTLRAIPSVSTQEETQVILPQETNNAENLQEEITQE
ncbi:hypothetical protein IJU97_03245 [bacterium]|nr:hypothetical protein [bacterium]